MAEEEDDSGGRSRRSALALSGVMVGSMFALGASVDVEEEKEENFSERIESYTEHAFHELASRDYENFLTDEEDLVVEEDASERGVYLRVGVDTNGEDIEDVESLLQRETYVKEGAEIFSTFADTILESDEVRELGLEFDPGLQEEGMAYTFGTNELRRAVNQDYSLGEIYEDEVLSS